MKIISFSDLHLEFGVPFSLPKDTDADVLILSGDIITFKDFSPLKPLLDGWNKPVIYVAGNHEYYTNKPMSESNMAFNEWLSKNYPNVSFLSDTFIDIDGVSFFGGTMWTDFMDSNPAAMQEALHSINDYNFIVSTPGQRLLPEDTVRMHQLYVTKLTNWLDNNVGKKRVIISHHAPLYKKDSAYSTSPLLPAFNSLDMLDVINNYQPDLWIYGHTHECDYQLIKNTKIISNQRGYRNTFGGFECLNFDEMGCPVVI